MKLLIAAAMVFAGSAANASVITCHDHWGKPAHVKFFGNGAAIMSARYGKSGFLRANGESSSSYYFRNGMGATLIVQKSVLTNGAGRVTYKVDKQGRDGDPAIWARFTCQ